MTATDLLAKINRVQVILGVLACIFGIVGFYVARNIDFQAAIGAETGFPVYELHLMPFNRLGALTVLVVGLVGLVGGIMRRPAVGFVVAAASLLLALQVLVQWRDKQPNALGTAGQNLTFAVLLAIGFGVTAVLARYAPSLDA